MNDFMDKLFEMMEFMDGDNAPTNLYVMLLVFPLIEIAFRIEDKLERGQG